MREALRRHCEEDDAGSVNILKRIAAALGKPETAFVDGPEALADLNDASEMLRLWDRLKHASDRRKVLAFAQSLAARD
ncbi:hypothetical protein MKK88_19075 [Methylobacterium sp. E-005]|uniref:hypothetical protein n=1 Tax=Methylobacterium sp. E-005 TaxID=2836549 RepID=UPI001FB94380|nr:hypothetical protein [Methylobacterium sp. E-005]MCJ2088068.1 hypothetical protein [Methylobacterium sp. E-005]